MNEQCETDWRGPGASWPVRLVLLLLFLGIASPVRAGECVVFAAASLSDALQELGKSFEQTTGEQVYFNFAASSALARQVAEGARADLFFSADVAKVEQLSAKGLVKSQRKLLSNSLVFVVAPDSSLKFPADLLRLHRLALGETRTVPAGIYARQYLERVGLWQEVESRVIPMDNVRAALAAVESGNADAAIVYRTDAAISRKVKIAFEVQGAEAPDIGYVLAVLQEGRHPAVAEKFFKYLESSGAAKTFQKFGFVVLAAAENDHGNG